MKSKKTGIIDLRGSEDLWAYGHIDDSEATALAAEYAEEWDHDDPGPCVAVHHHARWIFPRADDSDDGRTMTFDVPVPAGRGAFKVSQIVTVAQREREQEDRRQREANVEAWRADVLRRYPGALDLRVWSGGATQPTYADFRLDGLHGTVHMRSDKPGKALVQNRDLEAFRALYGAEGGA